MFVLFLFLCSRVGRSAATFPYSAVPYHAFSHVPQFISPSPFRSHSPSVLGHVLVQLAVLYPCSSVHSRSSVPFPSLPFLSPWFSSSLLTPVLSLPFNLVHLLHLRSFVFHPPRRSWATVPSRSTVLLSSFVTFLPFSSVHVFSVQFSVSPFIFLSLISPFSLSNVISLSSLCLLPPLSFSLSFHLLSPSPSPYPSKAFLPPSPLL